MNEKLHMLFAFKEDIERVLKQYWPEITKKELEERLKIIKEEIGKEERDQYAQSEDNRRIQNELKKDMESNCLPNGREFWR